MEQIGVFKGFIGVFGWIRGLEYFDILHNLVRFRL